MVSKFFSSVRRIAICLAVLAVVACARPEGSGVGIYDPDEASNRQMHQFNLDVDTTLVDPLSQGYGKGVPQGVRDSVGYFSDNLLVPMDVVNNVLQADFEGAGVNSARFLVNSTIGVAGIFDAATAFKIGRRETNFGETMHVWGAPEGAYNELPFFGPSTDRDTTGLTVDLLLNPLNFLNFQSVAVVGFVAYVADRFNDRYEYADLVDSIYYESADSYTQTRILYLQNRRFELGMTAEDMYLNPEFDPYEDPYEDF